MKSVLITRQKNQSQEIAKLFEVQGFTTFIEPLFLVEKIDVKKQIFSERFSAAIVTSINACSALNDFSFPKNKKIFAVGKKTAEELRKNGFKNIAVSQENSAASLLDLIIETHKEKLDSILYFHGSIINLDFEKELKNFGFKVRKILSYKTHESENFSSELLEFSRQKSFDHVLIFSQNSAKIFEKLARKNNLLEYFKASQLVCLSDKIRLDVKNFQFQNPITFDQFPILKNFYD
jgi:uroporphyrinogen-III synthase